MEHTLSEEAPIWGFQGTRPIDGSANNIQKEEARNRLGRDQHRSQRRTRERFQLKRRGRCSIANALGWNEMESDDFEVGLHYFIGEVVGRSPERLYKRLVRKVYV